jgi:hypothetical protein
VRVIFSALGVIDAVLVQLTLPSIKIRRHIVGDLQRLHPPHRGEDAGDLLGRHGSVVIGKIGGDMENDLRAIGEVFGRGHFDSTVVDHGTNDGHGCDSSPSRTTRAARAAEPAQFLAAGRALNLVFASRAPSFYQTECQEVAIDLSRRLLRPGSRPVDPPAGRVAEDRPGRR